MMCSTSAVPKLGTLRTTTLSAVQAAQLTAPPRVHVGSVLRLLTEAEREVRAQLCKLHAVCTLPETWVCC